MGESHSSIFPVGILYRRWREEVIAMGEVFGGYTRWAVVFLIIFVLFFLFVPH